MFDNTKNVSNWLGYRMDSCVQSALGHSSDRFAPTYVFDEESEVPSLPVHPWIPASAGMTEIGRTTGPAPGIPRSQRFAGSRPLRFAKGALID